MFVSMSCKISRKYIVDEAKYYVWSPNIPPPCEMFVRFLGDEQSEGSVCDQLTVSFGPEE